MKGDDESVDEPPPPPTSCPTESIAAPGVARITDPSRSRNASAAAVDGAAVKKGVAASSASTRPGAPTLSGRAGVKAALAQAESGSLHESSVRGSAAAAAAEPPNSAAEADPTAPAVSGGGAATDGRHRSTAASASAVSIARKRRLMEEKYGSQPPDPRLEDEDDEEEQHLRNQPPQTDLPQVVRPIAIEVVATPVPMDEDDKGRGRRRNTFKDWRVLVLIMVAVGLIVGLTTALVMNNKNDSGNGGDASPKEPSEGVGPPKKKVVEIGRFSMVLVSIVDIDEKSLIEVTTSHLAEEMSNAFSAFRSLELFATLEQARRNGRTLRRLTKTTRASFGGFMELDGGFSPPRKVVVLSVQAAAFSGSKLDGWLESAKNDVGVISVTAFNADGEETGSSQLVDAPAESPPTTRAPAAEGGGQHPVPPPSTMPTATATATGSSPATPEPTRSLTEGDRPISPTWKPTVPSSLEPTNAPTTAAPTFRPTPVPTEAPAAPPTVPSSLEPTNAPTTAASTFRPTPGPTEAPAVPPTNPPVSDPTPAPTDGKETSPPPPTPPPPPPQILGTPLAWKFSRAGAMFDVFAKGSSVTITSIDVHIEGTGTDIPIEVWTRRGSHVGYESNPSAWTFQNRGEPYVIPRGQGAGRLTPVPPERFEPIDIPRGGKVGFYVTLQSNKGMLVGQGSDATEDGNLRIESGASKGYRFGSTNYRRTWNGAISYIVSP